MKGYIKSSIGAEVFPLFPVPLYTNHLNRPFHKHEHECFGDVLERMKHNRGNLISEDSFVLNDDRLSALKIWIQSCIDDYFNIIICSSEDFEPYVTISWLNYAEEKQYHHQHDHGNSIISGVLYIDADEMTDNITFHKNIYNSSPYIKIEPSQYNLYNSGNWTVPVQKQKLILFPSTLQHSVSNLSSNKTRISLSFNVFVKGVVGNVIDKTFLELGN